MSKRKLRNNVTVNNGENIEVNPETKEEQGTPVQPEENPGEDQNSHEDKGHRKPSIKKQAAAVGTTIVKGVKHAGKIVWRNRGKIGIVAGAAVVLLAKLATPDTSVDVYVDEDDSDRKLVVIETPEPETEETEE